MDDDTTLEGCRRSLERLREENELLRRSSRSFGELAERLNAWLRHHKSTGSADHGLAGGTQGLGGQPPD